MASKYQSQSNLGLFAAALGLAVTGCTADFDIHAMDATGYEDDGDDSGEVPDSDDQDAGGQDGGGQDSGGQDSGGQDGGGQDGDGEPRACENVDMLFVIDNSSSMGAEQVKLDLAVGRFMDATFDLLADASVHIGVVSSDDDALNTTGDNLLPCDFGQDADWISHTGPATYELQARVHCAIQVGLLGDEDERPIENLLGAISPTAPDGNIGFSRPDAKLVVVLITDEDDVASAANPGNWLGELIELRGGADQVVMLSLLGDDSDACKVDLGLPALGELFDIPTMAEPGDRLRALTQALPYHQVGNICDVDYDPYFDAAITTIADACG